MAAGNAEASPSTGAAPIWYVTTRGVGHGSQPGTRRIVGVPEIVKQIERNEDGGWKMGGHSS